MELSSSSYTGQAVYSQKEFCESHRISRTHLHVLTKAGLGPRTFTCGRRVLISVESATEWRRRMEAASSEGK